MNIFYKSERIGKKGKTFLMYKFRTLKEGNNKSLGNSNYTLCGRFLRKTKIDELPQLWNWVKGDLAIIGVRPEEKRTIDLLPKDIQETLVSKKPGMTSLASIYFVDEEKILSLSTDPYKTYWTQIKPMKIVLDVFYIRNRDLFLDAWILWKTGVRVIQSFFR